MNTAFAFWVALFFAAAWIVYLSLKGEYVWAAWFGLTVVFLILARIFAKKKDSRVAE
jgi:hypothetical protein